MWRQELNNCFEFYESELWEVIRGIPKRYLCLLRAIDQIFLSLIPLQTYFCIVDKKTAHHMYWLSWKLKYPNLHPWIAQLLPNYICILFNFYDFISRKDYEFEYTISYCVLFVLYYDQYRNSLINKPDDSLFGMNIKMVIRKKYLSLLEVDQFPCEALTVYRQTIDYSQKWSKFGKLPYYHFPAFSMHIAL